ncbi:hypothetical protein TrLO_g1330 [Triparma laevis f. longispina]|uniref:Uncharacterized protein n=1 Tax=Triparma laevis f. longispina TaxID=1714387 RepID=A0A9W7FS87_9STRA|nr:hypothetical protein TrLO_g1330 [Triparma laevis f. longispina]
MSESESSSPQRKPNPASRLPLSSETLIPSITKSIRRLSWLSWWLLLFLTAASSGTLIFAKTIQTQSLPSTTTITSSGPGSFLTLFGVSIKCVMVMYMWGYARLSSRLTRLNQTGSSETSVLQKSKSMILTATKLGILMPMIGLAITVVGGEEIVGSLTAKALVNQNLMSAGSVDSRVIAVAGVSVVDLLVIQSNINTIAGLFWALGVGMWIRGKGRKIEKELEKLEETE